MKDQENLQATKPVTRLKYEDVYGSDDSLDSGEGKSYYYNQNNTMLF